MRLIAVILLSLAIVGCNENSSTKTAEEEKGSIEIKKEPKAEKTKVDHDKEKTKTWDNIPVKIDPEKYLTQTFERRFLSTTKYDAKIRKEVQRWLPMVDWTIVKAQFYQESKLDPDVESNVGAKGIAQFMPATWEEVKQDLNFGNISRTNPDISIKAGAYYDSKLWKFWSAPRPNYHRVAFMLASYNAGAGNLVNAQKACGGSNMFDDVFTCLPEITGKHAEETEGYVNNIFNLYVIEKLN